MFKNGSFYLGLLGALLVIAILAGIGYAGYQFGYVQGVADAPEVADAITAVLESGQALTIPPMVRDGSAYANPLMWSPIHRGLMPYGGGNMHGGFGFIGCILGLLLLIFLLVGLKRLFFHMHWCPGTHPYWHGRPWGAPPWAQEGKEGGADPAQK